MSLTNCPRCGAEAELEAGKCPECGAELVVEVEAVPELPSGGPSAPPFDAPGGPSASPFDAPGGPEMPPGGLGDLLAGALGRILRRNVYAEFGYRLGLASLVPLFGLFAVIPAAVYGWRGVKLWRSNRRVGGLGKSLAALALGAGSILLHALFAAWIFGALD